MGALDRLAEYLDGYTLETYLRDRKTRAAAERELITVGEALGNVRKLDRAAFGRISDGRRIVDFRAVMVHGYAVISDRIVREAALSRAPDLRTQLLKLLAE